VKKVSWLLTFSFLLILSLAGCSGGNTTQPIQNAAQVKPIEITVSAAASMQKSLKELQKAYTQKTPGVEINYNFGASGTLQQQIEQGASVDLFISAGKSQMDALEQKNLIVKDSRINLLSNVLVLITGKDNSTVTSLQDLTKASVGKVSIGTPKSVPAGKYAQESLANLKLWDALQPKLVYAQDVSQVLNYVETGNADAGIVYQSDAQGSTKAKVVEAIPASSHKAIVYPVAEIVNTKNKQATDDFLKYLASAEAQKVFANYGFETITK
jgi:molybdate transport system substrate-binding protein